MDEENKSSRQSSSIVANPDFEHYYESDDELPIVIQSLNRMVNIEKDRFNPRRFVSKAEACFEINHWEKKLRLEESFKKLKLDQDIYKTDNIKVVMINHVVFKDQKLNREGAEVDEKIREILKNLNFSYQPKHDSILTLEKQNKYIDEALADMKNHDCLIFIISTHGKLNKLLAYDKEFSITELIDRFKSAPELQGKPKIIMINACRDDPMSKNSIFEEDRKIQKRVTYDLEDYILVFSTSPGEKSLRNENGCLLLRSFRRALEEIGKPEIKDDCPVTYLFKDIEKHVETNRNQKINMTYNLKKAFLIGKRSNGTEQNKIRNSFGWHR